jgi:hypothetical protein
VALVSAAAVSVGVREGPAELEGGVVSSAGGWRVLAKLRSLGGATGSWRLIQGCSMHDCYTGQLYGGCGGSLGVLGGPAELEEVPCGLCHQKTEIH